MTRLDLVGRLGPDALNSLKICPDSGCTASQSCGPGFGIGSNSDASAENARQRTGNNPARSLTAASLTSGPGCSKPMLRDATQTTAAVFHTSHPGLSTSYETVRLQ